MNLLFLVVVCSSLADLGAQVQNLLKDKLERDLGRPLERNGGGGVSKQATNGGGNIVPQDLDQVGLRHCRTRCVLLLLLSFVFAVEQRSCASAFFFLRRHHGISHASKCGAL